MPQDYNPATAGSDSKAEVELWIISPSLRFICLKWGFASTIRYVHVNLLHGGGQKEQVSVGDRRNSAEPRACSWPRRVVESGESFRKTPCRPHRCRSCRRRSGRGREAAPRDAILYRPDEDDHRS